MPARIRAITWASSPPPGCTSRKPLPSMIPCTGRLYAELMPNDMLLQLLVHSAIPLACLGYVDQALSRVDAALVVARDSPHPLNLAVALTLLGLRAGLFVRSRKDCCCSRTRNRHFRSSMDLGLFRSLALAQRGWCLAAWGRLKRESRSSPTALLSEKALASCLASRCCSLASRRHARWQASCNSR